MEKKKMIERYVTYAIFAFGHGQLVVFHDEKRGKPHMFFGTALTNEDIPLFTGPKGVADEMAFSWSLFSAIGVHGCESGAQRFLAAILDEDAAIRARKGVSTASFGFRNIYAYDLDRAFFIDPCY